LPDEVPGSGTRCVKGSTNSLTVRVSARLANASR
jgi:hypothetical protein